VLLQLPALACGRGLYSSTSQLILKRFCHSKHTVTPLVHPQITPKLLRNSP